MAVKAYSVSDDTFEKDVLQSPKPVLVDFYADWCGPCKLIAPLLDWAAAEFEEHLKIVKMDTEENPKYLRDYNIAGLPTLILLKDGEVLARHEGAIGKKPFVGFLAQHVPELASSAI